MLMQRWEKIALPVFLLVVLCLASVYNLVSTSFEAPDEIGHYFYVRHLLQERRLPVIPDPESFPQYAQEGTQGPLYYVGAALFAQVLRGPLDLNFESTAEEFVFNPYSTCGQLNAQHNVVALAHDPRQEAFPYAGRVRVLHVLRLWSTLLAVGTVAGVFVGARLFSPDYPLVAWFAAGLTAGMPEFLFTAGAVNNDNMITVLGTWAVVFMLSMYRQGVRWWHPPLLGLLSGLAALSKASGVLLLPLACITFVGVYRQGAPTRSRLVTLLRHLLAPWAAATVICLAVAGWWFVRNWQLYGDPTGTLGHLAVMPLRETMNLSIFFQELPGLFLSWWGVFGCTMPPVYFYIVAGVITVGGLLGLIYGCADLKPRRALALIFLLWIGLMWLAYIQWNWVIHAAKGRLLYPLLLPWNTFLGFGWAYWARRWRWVTPILGGVLVVLAGLIPFSVMSPPVAPPPIYTDITALQIQHPYEGRFGEAIALRGYALNHNSFAPGQTLDLTLYWQAEQQPAQHYSLAIQLVSAIPGDTTMLLNFNGWPGDGNYPTGYWQPGDVIVDRYRLQLPETVARAQAWRLHVVLYETATGRRLPWSVAGSVIDDNAALTLVRVGATTAPSPPAETLAAPVIFQGAIKLHAVTLTPTADQLRVTVWWESLAPLPVDYTLFVHLLDVTGDTLTNADAPPLAGGFPTTLWQPGDVIQDEYILPLPAAPASTYTVSLGWYDPQTGARLEAVQNAAVLPDAALTIPYHP